MVLDATTKSIQVSLAGTVATRQLPCVTSWADMTTSSFTPGSSDTQTNNTTAVTVVAAPASSTQRQVKLMSIYNADTANAVVTVALNNNSTLRTMVSVTLKVGQTLQFAENAWSVIDSSGSLQDSGGASVSAAGSDSQIQYNNGGSALGGDPNLTWSDTSQIMALSGSTPMIQLSGTTGSPASSAAGTVGVFSRIVANRPLAAQIGPSGLATALQPFLARNKIGYWDPPGNATTVPGVFGITAPTVVGTATARNVATTNLATRMRRLGFVSSSTAGSLAEARVAAAQFSCGSGSNDGSGFFFVIRWVPSDAATVAGERNFVGLMNSTSAATNVEPNTLTNTIGVAQLSTDATQLYIVYGGSSAQTQIALGTNFPGATISTTAYELAIFAPNSVSNTFYYQVTNITTGNIATGTLTGNATQVPQNSTLLAPRAWATNNATALAVGFDICSIYIETDN
ncbi:MAG TPA: hypothetical protein VLE99_03660 [Candidatus Saccharimonadales bacterium]|nr:hypothetical protein [Candidatus Saccharimonadales bacterium]